MFMMTSVEKSGRKMRTERSWRPLGQFSVCIICTLLLTVCLAAAAAATETDTAPSQTQDANAASAVSAQTQETEAAAAQKAAQMVTITLKPVKGTLDVKEVTVKKKGKLGKLPVPVRAGYRFLGWYTAKSGGTKVKETTKTSVVKKKVLYAHWKVRQYKITYKYRGGKLKKGSRNPTKYTVEKKVKFKKPSKTGYLFKGWYTDNNYSEESKVTSILPGTMTGNLTLYAKYEEIVTSDYNFKGKNNIEKLVNYLVENGFTKEAAAGVAGNLMWESGGGPTDIKLNAVELKTGRGVGMAQWTDTKDSPRRTTFVNYCKSQGKPWPNQDLKVQIDFLLAECNGKYGKAWVFSPKMGYDKKYEMTFEDFKKCTNVSKATKVFCACFERPYAKNAHMSTRVKYAKIALAYLQ